MLLGLLAGAGLLFARCLDDPPGRDRVAADLVLGGELLAYEVWDGVPHVVFRSRDGNAILLDHLRLDWISIGFPPTPAWQLSGDWAKLRPTDNPASIGVVQHHQVELFGQLNSVTIKTFEVEYGGQWHSFRVTWPAYLIRLPAFEGIPTGYRWLDANGDVVWWEGPVPPLGNWVRSRSVGCPPQAAGSGRLVDRREF